MKGLGQFRQFDWAGFSAGKAYQVVGVSDWLDRDTGKRLGKRVDVVITSDNTQYEHRNGEQFTNLYQRLTFKIEGSAAVDVAIGDIVISMDHVRAQAAEYGHSERRECGYLLTHGLFHLMGYDHMTEAEKPVMRAMEEKALASIGLTREE